MVSLADGLGLSFTLKNSYLRRCPRLKGEEKQELQKENQPVNHSTAAHAHTRAATLNQTTYRNSCSRLVFSHRGRNRNPDSVAAVVKTLRTFSAVATVVVAVSLVGRLKRVDDASNMSHDIRLVGGFILVMLCENASVDSIEKWCASYAVRKLTLKKTSSAIV